VKEGIPRTLISFKSKSLYESLLKENILILLEVEFHLVIEKIQKVREDK